MKASSPCFHWSYLLCEEKIHLNQKIKSLEWLDVYLLPTTTHTKSLKIEWINNVLKDTWKFQRPNIRTHKVRFSMENSSSDSEYRIQVTETLFTFTHWYEDDFRIHTEKRKIS